MKCSAGSSQRAAVSATARSTSPRVPGAAGARRIGKRRQQSLLEIAQRRVGLLLPGGRARLGTVDELVGEARETVERVDVRPLPGRQQPGRQVVGAAVRGVQPPAGVVRGSQLGRRAARLADEGGAHGSREDQTTESAAADQRQQQRQPGEPAADLLVRDVVADRAARGPGRPA